MFLGIFVLMFIVFTAEGLPVAEPVEQTQMDDTPYAAVLNSTDDNEHVNYDQRQFGKYNIHLSIKDVNIIEMEPSATYEEENYNDNEYYDEEPQYISTSTEIPTTSAEALNVPVILKQSSFQSHATESPLVKLKMLQQQENLKHMQIMKTDFEKQLHENSMQHPQSHAKQLIFPRRKSQQQQLKRFDTNVINYPNPIIHQFQPYRCHANQYRDLNGNCHVRRASSASNSATAILRKFFDMLVGLPVSHIRDSE